MMSVIAANNAAIRLPTAPTTKPAGGAEETAETFAPAVDSKAAEGVAVKISSAGFRAAKNDSNNKDIDDSNLKDNVKQLLKMIRELKKQIADKRAEIASVMADSAMSPDQRQVRMSNLQSSLASLQGSLSMASVQLGKAMKDESPQAQLEAMALAAK